MASADLFPFAPSYTQTISTAKGPVKINLKQPNYELSAVPELQSSVVPERHPLKFRPSDSHRRWHRQSEEDPYQDVFSF
ncbi:hypothetical protein PRZ48_007635 [Zasmidium cellare]|uniref:Uncharacterized protein n=1 Tax=Zasmidium cellare TaxID=395010 RepID=A0ABR0EJV9_ZASCE|nr:hypothetical protein PRZ48_007635 [Zasmidium cellare]